MGKEAEEKKREVTMDKGEERFFVTRFSISVYIQIRKKCLVQ